MFALLRRPFYKEKSMGYRYRHGGWHDRMYRATVMVNEKPRTVTYSCCFGLNMYGNFVDLRNRVQRLFGAKITKDDVIGCRLLADWEE